MRPKKPTIDFVANDIIKNPCSDLKPYSEPALREAVGRTIGLTKIVGPVKKSHILTAAIYALAQEEEILNEHRAIVQSATVHVVNHGTTQFSTGPRNRTFRQEFPAVASRVWFARKILARIYGLRDKKKIITDLKFLHQQIGEAIRKLEIG